jgi:hypothetical protein
MELATEQKKIAEEARAEAEHQTMISIQARSEAVHQRMISQESATTTIEKHETVAQLKKELEAQRKIAEQNEVLAIKNAEQARRVEMLATQSELLAKKALEECQKKKQ